MSFGNLPSFQYLLSLPLLRSCVSFGVRGLPVFTGVRVDIVVGPLLAVLSASVRMFNAHEFDHTVHVMSMSSTTVHKYVHIQQYELAISLSGH